MDSLYALYRDGKIDPCPTVYPSQQEVLVKLKHNLCEFGAESLVYVFLSAEYSMHFDASGDYSITVEFEPGSPWDVFKTAMTAWKRGMKRMQISPPQDQV